MLSSGPATWAFTLLMLAGGVTSSAAPVHVISLSAEPSSVELIGPRAEGRVVLIARLSDGRTVDVTARAAALKSSTPIARVSPGAVLRPVKDGAGVVWFAYGGRKAAVRVGTTGSHATVPVSFNLEVIPTLTRAGCNMGACHGSQFGKAGFKLSLFGTDTGLDYHSIARQYKGRRICVADAAHSLILLKPTMTVPHGGGRRLVVGSAPYRTLLAWLQDGAPGPLTSDPTVTGVRVYPAERTFVAAGARQALVAYATYSDGTVRDVTDRAVFSTLDDGVATCTPQGIVTASGKGQTAVMVRYCGQATVATVIIPFNRVVAHAAVRAIPVSDYVDRLVTRKQRQLGLTPSRTCDDATFIRRLYVDVIGTLPRPHEVTRFLADKRPNKRAALIDTVLARPEYADYWTLKWGDLLRSNRTPLGVKGMWSLTNWIHAQFAGNRPFDQFVRDLILAQGSTYTDGPCNYYRSASDPQTLAETTSQLFLGVRLQCARCHHHPYEKWSQDDYYHFAAFFARVGLKGSNDFGIFGNEQVVLVRDSGEVRQPATGSVMQPIALGAVRAMAAAGAQPADPDASGDRRAALADWLVSKQNTLFARNIVNRYWGYLMGKGLVNPIDDERVTNPPSNPELLDALADDFARSGYDLKHLLRVICNSLAYQRSSQANLGNRGDETFYTHYLPRRMQAEPLLDAINSACGTRAHFPDMPPDTRAIDLPDPQVSSDFLDVFGRPQRLTDCECERTVEPNLSQTLLLMNGDMINNRVSSANGRVAKLISAGDSDAEILGDLYMVTLCREPTRRERDELLGVLAFTPNNGRAAAFQDILISLLNSKEFLFNH